MSWDGNRFMKYSCCSTLFYKKLAFILQESTLSVLITDEKNFFIGQDGLSMVTQSNYTKHYNNILNLLI